MPTLRIPALMKFYVADQTEVPLQGASIADILSDLVTHYPAIKPHIMDKNGDLRRYVNLFVNDANIKDLDGLNTPVRETDRVILLPSISGGSSGCQNQDFFHPKTRISINYPQKS